MSRTDDIESAAERTRDRLTESERDVLMAQFVRDCREDEFEAWLWDRLIEQLECDEAGLRDCA
jgi:hypothetical protein